MSDVFDRFETAILTIAVLFFTEGADNSGHFSNMQTQNFGGKSIFDGEDGLEVGGKLYAQEVSL